ncbi:thermonuclease family protein [Comamonas jiangduensis]
MLTRTPSLIALVACLAIPVHAAQPWFLRGEVVRVTDGDTIRLREHDTGVIHSIRISDIDAPETSKSKRRPGQPFSQASRKAMVDMALNQNAVAKCFEYDRNSRPVCTVVVNGKDVGAMLVSQGLAWANRASKRYVRDPRTYELEAKAKADRLGLWADPEAVEPWVWRRLCWTKKEVLPATCTSYSANVS